MRVFSTVLAGLLLLAAVLGASGQQDVASATPPTGDPFSLDFPRLGMWWPNPHVHPLEDIARYDWVILGDWQAEFIAPLRELNPDILLLNSDNACEVTFDPAPDAPPWANAFVRQLPPEWFLTQVGSTLVEPVDDTTTVFRVADLTASDGETTYDLFVVGDAVLIEGETVYVEAIDPATNTLTVQRGYVRPAAPHATGTRLAAHVTFWPGSWLLNLATNSPPVIIDPAVGPEILVEFHARYTATLATNDDWDGILIDRSDPDESWLIGNSTARTIDPDRSNTLLTDYAQFDEDWNTGLRRYESLVREAVGPDTIIFANWGMTNYDLLNGNNFEGFPGDVSTEYDFGMMWEALVFGRTTYGWADRRGSYFEWMAQSQDPNLTMIETYEDNGGPDPAGSLDYDNPCDAPDFVPNYRKMRFGLATTLLNDGFFSYEINTNGHGSLCLLWFDEYDNAGAGRGYLGQPLGPARQVAPSLTTPNLLSDSTFEADTGRWDVWANDVYSVGSALDTSTAAEGSSSARIDVPETQGTFWEVSASTGPVLVEAGTEYTLSFWAKANTERPIMAWIQQDSDPWQDYAWFGDIPLTPDWQHFTLTAQATGDNPAARFYFGLGTNGGQVWVDDVRLQAGSLRVWRRDYEGGIVLINVTSTPQTIDLEGTFQKINGTQAPDINDGSRVTEVTLPPYDGLILLRVE
ncbi:MAG: hypothetical protein GYB65_14775 [Chloroflexi bacterium]|nr:hypothetical protein [Chloroflexota bacterium]